MDVAITVQIARTRSDTCAIVHGGLRVVIGCPGEGTSHKLYAVAQSVLVEIAATYFGTPYTWVHIVTDAIGIRVLGAIAATNAQGIKLVAIAIAVPFWDVSASTLVDATWSVADATSIKRAYTIVQVVADAIGIQVLGAIAATNAQGVKLVAIAIAIPFWNVYTSTLEDVS